MELVIGKVSKQHRGDFWGLRGFSLTLGPALYLAFHLKPLLDEVGQDEYLHAQPREVIGYHQLS